MLIALFKRTPFVRPIMASTPPVVLRASQKFITLWVLSILPLVFAGLRAKPAGGENSAAAFFRSVLAEFNTTSLFVYSISFLVPMLYLAYERLTEVVPYAFSRKVAPEGLSLPQGMGLPLFTACVVFLFTAFAYNVNQDGDDVLANVLDAGLTWAIYGYAMYCWFLVVLMAQPPNAADAFTSAYRSQEKDIQTGFSKRVKDNRDVK